MKARLGNEYGLYTQYCNGVYSGAHFVEAVFDGELQIVFQGVSRKDCLQWCHRNGIRMAEKREFIWQRCYANHRATAKTPYNPDEHRIAIIR